MMLQMILSSNHHIASFTCSPLVMEKMEDVYQRSFRDKAELNQATQFLHDNGRFAFLDFYVNAL